MFHISATFTLASTIVYPKGIRLKKPDAEIGSAIGLAIFAIFIEVVMPWILFMSISRRFFVDVKKLERVLCGCGTDAMEHSTLPSRASTSNVSTIETTSTRCSVGASVTSLTEQETFHRFEEDMFTYPIRHTVSAEVYSGSVCGNPAAGEHDTRISTESIV